MFPPRTFLYLAKSILLYVSLSFLAPVMEIVMENVSLTYRLDVPLTINASKGSSMTFGFIKNL